MSGDETYLEAFIESISTLPSELRRNLCHLKSLDQSCISIVSQLRDVEEDYIQRAHDVITSLPVSQRSVTQESPNKRRKLSREKETLTPKTESQQSSPSSDTNKIKASKQELKANDEHDNDDEDCDDLDDNNGNFWTSPNHGIPVTTPEGETVLVVPTTEELRAKIRNPALEVDIARLRRDAMQYSDEKVAVADQTYAIIDAAVKRLDTDLEKFEGLLKGAGCFETTTGAQPDDLAAIQVTPNSPDWILAKVISHDTTSGMYKLSDEDIESNKTFTLPESQVVILGGVDRLSKSDIIYAVYPDTTSFYQATVVQAPRKVSGGGESFVMVHFKDDGDENGITHDKAVLMKHIMRVPYGAIQ